MLTTTQPKLENIQPNAISIIIELCLPNTPHPVKHSRAHSTEHSPFPICPMKAFLGISMNSFIHSSQLTTTPQRFCNSKDSPQQSYFNLFADYRHCYDKRRALTLGHYAMKFTADQTACNAHQQPRLQNGKITNRNDCPSLAIIIQARSIVTLKS